MRQIESAIAAMLGDGAAEALQGLANAAMELDPVARARLRHLAGHAILLRLESSGDLMTIRIDEQGLRIDSVAPPAPSVILTADAPTLAALLLGSERSSGAVQGDETILLELNAILRGMRPDLTRPLAPIIGEGPANVLADALDMAAAAFGSLAESVTGASREALQREGRRHALDRDSFDELLAGIHRLRLALNRLDARVTLLERDAAARASGGGGPHEAS